MDISMLKIYIQIIATLATNREKYKKKKERKYIRYFEWHNMFSESI